MDFSNVAVDGMANFDATDICNDWLGTSGCLSNTGSDMAVFWINGNNAYFDRFAYGERRGERRSRIAVTDVSSWTKKAFNDN